MTQLVTKPLSWFKVNPQVRKTFDETDLRHLGESLKVKQLQPVLAQPDGTLIAGERRYRAAMLVGLATLEAKIADEQLTDSQIKLWQLQENMLRDDLKPLEQIDGVEELARLNPELQNREIAERLHVDPSMVTRLRAVAQCQVARAGLMNGTLKGISDAYAIAKAPEEQKAALLSMKLHGASRDQIEKAGRKARTMTPSEAKVSRIPIRLPGGVSVVIGGTEMSLDDAIEALSEVLKSARKSRDEGLTVKSWAAAMKDKAKAP